MNVSELIASLPSEIEDMIYEYARDNGEDVVNELKLVFHTIKLIKHYNQLMIELFLYFEFLEEYDDEEN
jgi:hypothetical protein